MNKFYLRTTNLKNSVEAPKTSYDALSILFDSRITFVCVAANFDNTLKIISRAGLRVFSDFSLNISDFVVDFDSRIYPRIQSLYNRLESRLKLIISKNLQP